MSTILLASSYSSHYYSTTGNENLLRVNAPRHWINASHWEPLTVWDCSNQIMSWPWGDLSKRGVRTGCWQQQCIQVDPGQWDYRVSDALCGQGLSNPKRFFCGCQAGLDSRAGWCSHAYCLPWARRIYWIGYTTWSFSNNVTPGTAKVTLRVQFTCSNTAVAELSTGSITSYLCSARFVTQGLVESVGGVFFQFSGVNISFWFVTPI